MEGRKEDPTGGFPLHCPSEPDGFMPQGRVPRTFSKTGPCPYTGIQWFTFMEPDDLFQIPFCALLAFPEQCPEGSVKANHHGSASCTEPKVLWVRTAKGHNNDVLLKARGGGPGERDGVAQLSPQGVARTCLQ